MLEALGLDRARLVVISTTISAALRELEFLQRHRPEVPVMVRTRDEAHVEELRRAGAREVVPDTREAGLMIAVQVLLSLDVPLAHVMRRLQEQRRAISRVCVRSFLLKKSWASPSRETSACCAR